MTNLKIFTNNIDSKALDQVYNLTKLEPFKDSKIRIMPDVHAGSGCVIGFTSTFDNFVIPNIVGVDIGCGIIVVELGKLKNIKVALETLDNFIRVAIPHGRLVSSNIHPTAVNYVDGLLCKEHLKNKDNLYKSLGTLGGGNHFIEVGLDEENNAFLFIHSGSRNLGYQVATYYQNLAIELRTTTSKEQRNEIITKLKLAGKHSEIENTLKKLSNTEDNQKGIPKELSYLRGKNLENYLHDMNMCVEFADTNRKMMALRIVGMLLVNGFIKDIKSSFTTVHNYIGKDGIIRKGAISAYNGEKVVIPINMRDGCIIAVGKGNEDWNFSAPHGAGRIMSRNKAKEELSVTEFKEDMQGIFTTTADKSTIDESPRAYKPMNEIIENIKDTVDIVKIVKPIYSFKSFE